MRRIFNIILLVLVITANVQAAEDYIHFKEDMSVQQAEEIFNKINTNQIKSAVADQYKDIQKHHAEFYIEKLEFNSFVSGKKRPVFKIFFKTIDNWENEDEFCKFLTQQYAAQIDKKYLY